MAVSRNDQTRRLICSRQTCAFVAVALLAAGCETPLIGQLPEISEGGPVHHGVMHTVKRGQTLWRIARAYHVSAQELAEVNDLTDPKQLDVGLAIWIPRADHVIDVPPASAPSHQGNRTAHVEEEEPHPRIETHRTRFMWPVKGPLASHFGVRNGRQHDGIDIDAPSGTPIVAADGGQVLYAGVQHGYGNLVLLIHPDKLITVYAHNTTNMVKTGDFVRRGQEIGIVGRTGRATGPHLHFEVREDRVPRNPLFFLP